MEIPSLEWCIVDRFNMFGLSFYVKPGNNFKQLLIRSYPYNKDIYIRRHQFPKPKKWYEISISTRSGGVDYHVFIDDEQVSTAPININANELRVLVDGSFYYSKSCNPGIFPPPASPLPTYIGTTPQDVAITERETFVTSSVSSAVDVPIESGNTTPSFTQDPKDITEAPNTSVFLIFGQPWWIIAASGGATILLMILITIVIILLIRRKRTSNRGNPMRKHAWSINKSTSGDLSLQCQSFPTPEIRRQNAHPANDLHDLNSDATHTTAKPMQVQGFVYPANTCNKENTRKTISEIGQPVYDDEE
ncbi:hypothetical protein SK128_024807, partial [Halocaridina rubra]